MIGRTLMLSISVAVAGFVAGAATSGFKHYYQRFAEEEDMNDGTVTQVEIISDKKGRGGHPIIYWNITESGRMWRSDLGRFIQLGQRLEFYPESFFYLPSDGF